MAKIVHLNDEQVTLEILDEGVQVVVSALERSFAGFQGHGVGDVVEAEFVPGLPQGAERTHYAFIGIPCDAGS